MFSLFAETWTFQAGEKSDGYHWNKSANWVDSNGEHGVPKSGDSMEILIVPDAMHCADLRNSMIGVHFGPNAAGNVAYDGFYIREGGTGLVYEPKSASSWWCGLYLSGTVTVDIRESVDMGFDSGIQGMSSGYKGRFYKTGQGRIVSRSSSFNNLVGGVMHRGNIACSDTNAFPAGFDLYFDGTEGSSWLALEGASQNIANGFVHSATNTLPTTNHGLTDSSKGRKLTLSGNSPVDEQYFEGVLAGTLSFCWNQDDATKAFRFARGQSPTAGDLIASRGIVKIGDGASFAALRKLILGASGTIEIAADAGKVAAYRLDVTTGAKLKFADDRRLEVRDLWVDGVRMGDGTWTAATCPWIEGEGQVVVSLYRDTYGDNQIELTVPAGTTRTFAEAISDYNAAHETQYTTASLNGGDLQLWTLVKKGAGTLTMNETNKLYYGIVHVEEGTVDVAVQYGLGRWSDDSRPFYVHSGATILCNYPVKDNVSRLGDRIVHVAGTGVSGNGALRGVGAFLNYGSAKIFGKQIVLDDSALIYLRDWYTAASTLTLNDYTLTIRGTAAAGAVMFNTVSDNGKIVLIDCMSRDSGIKLNGKGPGNVMEFGNGGGFRFWSNAINGDGAKDWTFVFNGANTYLFGDCGETRDSGKNSFANRWYVTNTVNQSSQGNTAYSSIYLRGQVSGTGKFVLGSGNNEPNYLHFMNPLNDFSGGVTAGRGVICVYGNGTLPDTGTVTIKNDSIVKTSDMVAKPEFFGVALFSPEWCSLPPLSFYGSTSSSRVQGGRGSWKSIVKSGSNTLPYYSEAGSPIMNVLGGTVKLPRGAAPGLWEGVISCKNAAEAATTLAGSVTATNMIMRGPTSALQIPYQCPSGPSSTKLITYSGYVWNRTGADQTVTLASSVKGRAIVKVDGETVLDAAANERKRVNVTLTPGPHAFEYRSVNGSPTDATATWPARFGFVVDPPGCGDQAKTNDFVLGVDPGDGSFFTRTTNTVASLPRFDKIALAAGTTLDINGNRFVTADIAGAGTVKSTATDALAAPTLVVEKAVTVNAAANDTLLVQVPVELGADFNVNVTNCAHRIRARHTVLTATTPIICKSARIPVVSDDGLTWEAVVSADGKSLQAMRTGLVILVR